jgi:PKD repeat protein
MKKQLLLLCLLLISLFASSQTAADAAVQLSVQIQVSPAQITLNWPTTAATSNYQVFRKLKNTFTWGSAIASLPGTATQYVDNSVSVGVSYEYKVQRTASGYSGYGYINAGIKVPEIEYRGKLLLMVDSTFISSLSSEINRLIQDIEGDGWEVIRHNVLRTASVTHVKDLIVNDYNADTTHQTKAVFLLGHVPVPYSGNINPDGHPDHLGAWPADPYYGDVDGTWTDNAVTSTNASPARTQNVPGDGKFDQSIIPSDLELQVGRVDFNGMNTFTLTETQLLKNYLDKDHDYRKKIFTAIKRAVVDDNFGYFSGEAFAASGYKSFAPIVGTASITAADYITTMTGNSYQWSYGCGGGSFTSASGIGTTANLAAANLQGVFTMLFGSYFGDWDATNSFLKAPLAQGKVLTNVWSGRPHYQFHHMAQGENIGYGLILTQNNPGGLYYASPTGITGRWVHNALMGDPTLRNDVVAPVGSVIATRVGFNCLVNWSATTETNTVGYNLYRKHDSLPMYVKVNASPITGLSYTDTCLVYKGVYTYMVRALVLEVNPSGSYYNMSEGIADTAYNPHHIRGIAAFQYTTTGVTVHLSNTSTLNAGYSWDFGNGQFSAIANPTVSYAGNGMYQITLIASHQCYTDTESVIVNITEVGLQESPFAAAVAVYPNPSHMKVNIETGSFVIVAYSLFASDGKKLWGKEVMQTRTAIDLSNLAKGIYFLRLQGENGSCMKKIVVD